MSELERVALLLHLWEKGQGEKEEEREGGWWSEWSQLIVLYVGLTGHGSLKHAQPQLLAHPHMVSTRERKPIQPDRTAITDGLILPLLGGLPDRSTASHANAWLVPTANCCLVRHHHYDWNSKHCIPVETNDDKLLHCFSRFLSFTFSHSISSSLLISNSW